MSQDATPLTTTWWPRRPAPAEPPRRVPRRLVPPRALRRRPVPRRPVPRRPERSEPVPTKTGAKKAGAKKTGAKKAAGTAVDAGASSHEGTSERAVRVGHRTDGEAERRAQDRGQEVGGQPARCQEGGCPVGGRHQAAGERPHDQGSQDRERRGRAEPGQGGRPQGGDRPRGARRRAPWTAREIADVRDLLQSDEERLQVEISAVEEEIGHLLREGGEGAGHDQADVGSNTFERDHEMSMAKNARDNLALVKEAICADRRRHLRRVRVLWRTRSARCGCRRSRVPHCAWNASRDRNAAERRCGARAAHGEPSPSYVGVWALVAAGVVRARPGDEVAGAAPPHRRVSAQQVVGQLVPLDLTAQRRGRLQRGHRLHDRRSPWWRSSSWSSACGSPAGSGASAWAVALGLLLGGALGNVTDRLVRSPGPLRGHVVDFMQLPHWPVFNVADASICVGGRDVRRPDRPGGPARRLP